MPHQWECNTRCKALQLLLSAEEGISAEGTTAYSNICTRVFDCIAYAILKVRESDADDTMFAPELVWIYQVREVSIRNLQGHGIQMVNGFWDLIENLLHHAVIAHPFLQGSKPPMQWVVMRDARNWRSIARAYNLRGSLAPQGLGEQFLSLQFPQSSRATVQHRVISTHPMSPSDGLIGHITHPTLPILGTYPSVEPLLHGVLGEYL